MNVVEVNKHAETNVKMGTYSCKKNFNI